MSLGYSTPPIVVSFPTRRSSDLPVLVDGRIQYCATRNGIWACGLEFANVSPELRLETFANRSEEHTSELQSQFHIVCRPLLENKNRPCIRTPLKRTTRSMPHMPS